MSSNVTLRLAQRSDISTLAHIANAGNAQSALHRRIALCRDQHPIDYYHWRLNIIRQRFATPDLRTIVAEDSSSSEILGLASWVVEGSDTALYKQWVGESTWADWLEGKLVWAEKTWCRYVMDKSIDYKFLNRYMAAFQGTAKSARPACLHLHLIVVKPSTQSRGVGRMLVDWGKELAVREGLPLFLEANLEATGFYEKSGFSRLGKDLVVSPDGQESIRIPVFVWEGEQRVGRWLERDENVDGVGERWRWRDNVLSE
jgi:GNAT superfamily N-acetyltransferase